MQGRLPEDPTRRRVLALGALLVLMPRMAGAAAVREITWDDLIPPGLAYPEIIDEGKYDGNADELPLQLVDDLRVAALDLGAEFLEFREQSVDVDAATGQPSFSLLQKRMVVTADLNEAKFDVAPASQHHAEVQLHVLRQVLDRVL